MSGELLPLREAARELGVSSKTLRNAWARRRAGLPVGPWAALEAVQVGGRWYLRRQDLEAFLGGLAQPTAPGLGSLAAGLLELAADLERREPGLALRARALAELAGAPAALRVVQGGEP